jgi:glycosyltransferase involved in cell wall biosynthesis
LATYHAPVSGGWPFVEALGFGVPAVARAIGAVPETVSDAALLLDPVADLAVVAEALHLAVSDESLRSELRRRGDVRVAAYSPDDAAAKLGAAIDAIR